MPSILAWKDPACPVPVDFSVETMEKVRRLAFDGLLSLPRVGPGVGGFLLGIRKSRKITILDFHPIPCSHASGPSFVPTPAEVADAKIVIAGTGLAILGCYCSRPHRDIQFSDRELALFEGLCPGAGQLALLIRPSATDKTTAALFYRANGGMMAGGAVQIIEPVELPPEARPEAAAPSAGIREAVPAPPEPVRVPEIFGEPAPSSPVPAKTRGRFPWRTLLAAPVLAGLFAGAFLSRDRWLPRPPLELRTAETNGHFAVEWNRAAVRGLDRGVLTVTDGSLAKQIPLSAEQLQSGAIPWSRHSPRVTAVLVAGGARATAKFIAPELTPPEPSHP